MLVMMKQFAVPMKILVVLASVVAFVELVDAGASPPQVTIGVNGGTDGTVEVKPAIQWVTDTEVAGIDVQGGITSMIEDLGSITYKVWGKVKKSFGDFDVSCRADVDSQVADSVDLNLKLEGQGLMAQTAATAGSNTVDFKSVQAKARFGVVGGGKVTVNPRYNLQSSKADITIGYGLGDMGFTIDASKDSQKLTVKRAIGDKTTVAPSITTDGAFAFAVQQQTDFGTITGTYKLQKSLDVQWSEGSWMANVNAPMDGLTVKGVTFSAKKLIDF